MADVLLGRTDGIEGFERHVVLKRIRAEHARDRRFISMFVDEARLAAGLHHQNIVQVFDIGEQDGEYFFAMEYIHGEDVRKLLSAVARSRTYVPLPIVCAIVSAAAGALHYAHERRDAKGKPLSIVHRDVSPSNVLIGYDGSLKLVDFGIAKATLRTAETVVGSLKGKSSYMSPEQCKGEAIDRRSDVYGIGVLLYELATTTRLFKGDNEYLVMDAIVNGKFALPQVRRPDLPNDLSQIIMRALASDPSRRYQSADELRMELDQFSSGNDLNASTATIASYMKKIFGERPEPWLDLTSEPEQAGHSWSDTASGNPRDSRRSSRHLLSPPARTVPAVDTAPTMKLGWEATRHLQRARNSKWLWAAIPMVAVAAFAIWKLSAGGDNAPAPATPVAATQPAPAPIAPRVVGSPSAGIVPAATAQAVAAAAAPVAPPTAPIIAPPTAMTVEKKATPPSPPPRAKKTEVVAAAPAPAPAPKAAPVPLAAPVKVTAPAAAPAPVAAAAPLKAPVAAPVVTPPPAPVAVAAAAPAAPVADRVVEAAPTYTLSNATVASIAADHAKQLSACEAGATLRGDVAVSFQIDASGKVVRTQLASTIKNPKAAGCILRAVASWKFAKPPSGSAKGVYTISYQ